MNNNKIKETVPKSKKHIENVRKELTELFGDLTKIDSYAKNGSELTEVNFDVLVLTRTVKNRGIWEAKNSKDEFICWTIRQSEGRGKARIFFGFKTAEEATAYKKLKNIKDSL